MRKLKDLVKGTLRSVLTSAVAFTVSTGAALAQVPSFAAPPAQPSTFMVGVNFAPPVTGAGDLFCITGSASRLVKVKSIQLNGVASAAVTAAFNLVKRSTVDSGGTSTTPVGVPIDSAQVVPVATATMKAYTVVPTPGTSVGTISSRYLTLNTAAAGPTDDVSWVWTPTNLNSDVRLRNATESLCLNAPGTLTGATGISVEFLWTEQ